MNLFNLSKMQELLVAIAILAFVFGMKKLFGHDALEVFSVLVVLGALFLIWRYRYYAGLALIYIGGRYFLLLRKGWTGFATAVLTIGLLGYTSVQHFIILPPKIGTVVCNVRLDVYVRPLFSFRGTACSLPYYFFSLFAIAMIVGMVLYYRKLYKSFGQEE